jgi:uncharacterized protein
MFRRDIVGQLKRELDISPAVIQVTLGPRQVGKTMAAQQLMAEWPGPTRYAAADVPLPPGPEWIETHWREAERAARKADSPVLLVLDEVQKVRGWSEEVKRCWDETRVRDLPLRVLLLGASSLLLQRGLNESLAGRFFLHRCGHWTWPECQEAFGWDIERWLVLGGYPGSAPYADDPGRWQRYVADSLIEPVLSRDVLQMQVVHKPALLRHLFLFAAQLPAQIISYTKIMGQLQDAGNTTTLAHYVKLLETAFLLSGLSTYTRQPARRGGRPKLVLWNNALASGLAAPSPATAGNDPVWRGRLVENAVGAHLLNALSGPAWGVHYWRMGDAEVDYVVTRGDKVWGIEVKSGRGGRLAGMAQFRKAHPEARALVVGHGGIPLEEFFATTPADILAT